MSELKRIRELVERLPSDTSSDVISELVGLYLSAGLLDAALDAVKQWSANNPESDDGRVLAARVYLENALYDEVRSTLQQLDASSSAWRSGLLVEIDLEIRLGNFHLAEQKCADWRHFYGSGEELKRLEEMLDQQDADEEFDEPIVVTPTMADLYFRQGLVEKALLLYLKLLEQEPENALYQNRVKQIRGEQHGAEDAKNSLTPDNQRQQLSRWLLSIQRRRTHV